VVADVGLERVRSEIPYDAEELLMDTKPMSAQFAPREQMVMHENSETERRAAMLRVCSGAHNVDDARVLLEALGLLP
jgi:hypothetical protein